MNKKLLFNLAYWIMILVVIGTCIFLVIYLKSSGRECLAEPLEFYMKKMQTECYCMNNFISP